MPTNWIKKFKSIDVYKQTVNLRLTRQDKDSKTHKIVHKEKLGSIAGSLLTVGSWNMCFLYLIYLAFRMFNGQEDLMNKHMIANDFEAPNDQV
jgi:hypothetical protein